jgi:hypothetical protein
MALSAVTFCVIAFYADARGADTKLPDPQSETRIELSYSDKYLETPGLFHTISKQSLVADQWIRKADLLAAYDAAEPPLKHAAGSIENSAGSNAATVVDGSGNGIMVWGPYVELPAGDYVIVYRFKLEKAGDNQSPVFLDVCHNACTRSGIRLAPAQQEPGVWQEVGVPVSLAESAKLEFRFWPGGNSCAVDRVYLFRVVPGPEVKQQIVGEEELPFGKPVAGRSDVVTSPHTEEGGMIDISGLAQGTRVRCPYTGKYFRVP